MATTAGTVATPRTAGARRGVHRGTTGWRRFDPQLLVYAGALIAIGVVVGHAAAPASAAGDGVPQTTRTLIWAAIGLVALLATAAIDHRWLRTAAAPLYVVLVGLLVLTMVAGRTLYGARMSVSFLGLDFQLSEIGKVLMVVVLAAFLAGRGRAVSRPSTIVLATALVAAPALLVFRQPDLGTALVFAAILVGMLFLAGASVGWLSLVGGALLAAAPLAVSLLHEYQRRRLLCFLDPGVDAQGACFQLVQSLEAVASGGLGGRGLTVAAHAGPAQVPVQSTDFVFTVVAADLGFVGGAVLLALYGLLLWRILVVAWEAPDAFGSLVAGGVATVIVFQVVVNVGMAIGVMPVTGMPLPFVTYGGSSLVSLLVGIGVVESVRMRTPAR